MRYEIILDLKSDPVDTPKALTKKHLEAINGVHFGISRNLQYGSLVSKDTSHGTNRYAYTVHAVVRTPRRITSAVAHFHGDTVRHLDIKKQTSTLHLSTEAEYIADKCKKVVVEYVFRVTEEQLADIFTKALPDNDSNSFSQMLVLRSDMKQTVDTQKS
ncbi:hypothetical protein Tco_1161763 [Tanacetum coccineum]